MPRLIPLLACLVMLAQATRTTAAPLPAQPEPVPTTLPVPADTLALGQLNGLAATRDRLVKFVEVAAPDQLETFKKRYLQAQTDLFEGKDVTVLSGERRVYLALMGLEWLTQGGPKHYALLLPAKDYKTFCQKFLTAEERKSLEHGVGVVDQIQGDNGATYLVPLEKSGYVVMTPHKPTAERFAEKFTPLTRTLLGDDTADLLLKSDVATWINFPAILERYKMQYETLKKLVLGALQQGAFGLDERQRQITFWIMKGLLQAIEDCHGFTLGATVETKGITIRSRIDFRPETVLTQELKGERPQRFEQIGKLPAGQATYTASCTSPGLSTFLERLNPEFLPAPNDDKSLLAIEAYQKIVNSVGGWNTVSSGPTAGVQIATHPEPAKLTAAHRKVLRTLSQDALYQNIPVKEAPTLKEAEQTHAGFTFDRVTIKLDFEQATKTIMDENLRKATIESMKRLLAEKTTYWYGDDGKRFVQVNAPDWESAQKLLTTTLEEKAPIGSDKTFMKVMQALPTDSTRIAVMELNRGLLTLDGYLQSVIGSLPAFPGVEIPEAKAAQGVPIAYAGAALTLRRGSIEALLFLPTETVALARKTYGDPTAK